MINEEQSQLIGFGDSMHLQVSSRNVQIQFIADTPKHFKLLA